ncbi:hypothetical protein GCK72_019164 [Caenorhabditis remanei]|uniref:Uncharacterized protein n=1 Tax=Caenorhabditis remanei TaxID=31234 RepID=A0A6A5GDW0_CAERE|nr:hypothetical protein GCK72_019164 [Caenorhabditis remanei]KAF1752609.1 hypothetical protein GCK72_019164 [Caenorhabditis remanei]
MGSRTSKLGNKKNARETETSENQLDEERINSEKEDKDWEFIDDKNPEYQQYMFSTMDVENTPSLTGAVLVLSFQDPERNTDISEKSQNQREEKENHILIDPLCSEYYGLQLEVKLNQHSTYLERLGEIGNLSREVYKLCRIRLNNRKLYSLFLKAAGSMLDEPTVRRTLSTFQRYTSQYIVSESQKDVASISLKKKENKKFSLIRPFRNAARKLQLRFSQRKVKLKCKGSPSFGVRMYKTASFCYRKPYIAKELLVSTYRFVKVSHDAGIWTWKSIWKMMKPNLFVTNS